MKLLVIILALMLSTNVSVAKVSFGKCPMQTKTALEPFDINKFSGLWYDIIKSPNSDPQKICDQLLIRVEEFNVKMKFADYDYKFGKTEELTYVTSLPVSAGIMKFSHPHTDHGPNIFTGNLLVLGTDYNNYAVVYLCLERGKFYEDEIHLVSRTANLDKNFYSKMAEILVANDFKTVVPLQDTVQDCGKYRCRGENTNCAFSFSSINP